MKKAFTMIELIFVIVILGILAAVALPKFIGVAEEAREGNLKSFVGTLDRTIGPTLWSKAISSGHDGNISALGTEANLSNYTDIPQEITEHDATKCDDKVKFKVIAKAPKDKMGGEYNYYILCKTGTNSISPKFVLAKSKGDDTVENLKNTTFDVNFTNNTINGQINSKNVELVK